MSLTTYREMEQGSPEWFAARCGIVTASVVGKLITPSTLKVADNETSRGLTTQLTAERITGFVDPTFASADMERGNWDEPIARDLYAKHYAPVEQVGFMVREEDGWRLGYSPDGLVGDDGLIEVKSRRSKQQLDTILTKTVPIANRAQIQAGLLVSGRKFVDYVSYCAGMPLYVQRVTADQAWQDAIVAAAELFEKKTAEIVDAYSAAITGLHPTERIPEIPEMVV
jgi:hypothetical protein